MTQEMLLKAFAGAVADYARELLAKEDVDWSAVFDGCKCVSTLAGQWRMTETDLEAFIDARWSD